ncbi:Gamma-aminobutyric acid type B receptor subunit 1 [Folsomia candida]|uniref:Gamma-aminobutyric acid type B receptor subunit 2 n=1 Tax=Folsomia candida TaxID=158441 RepID=A0A226E2Q6_FOLCA|nr:Gamma-aminobutyric acid type B receptor subunit 1 [Folsomia candida]
MLFRNHSLLNLLHLITILSGMVAHVTPKCLEHIKDVTPKRFFQIENDILNITLETSSDIGHQLVTQAFAIFLREVLKYDSVNIVTYTDHFNINSSSQILQRLSGMDLLDNGAALLSNSRAPESQINLGVWFPSEWELERWNSPGLLENCGQLGFQGRFGWYIPRMSVVDENPMLDYWRTFKSNDNLIDLFSLDDEDYTTATTHHAWNAQTERFFCQESFCTNGMFTPPNLCQEGRRGGRKCAILLASYPESSMFLPEQITQLGLRVQVLWLGPNLDFFVKSLVAKYELRSGNRRRAVMFFSWKPMVLTLEFDTISVAFPPCDHDQFCYESRSLEKVVSSKLKEGAKTAYEAVHRLSFSYEEYTQLLKFYMDKTARDNENFVIETGGGSVMGEGISPNPTDVSLRRDPQLAAEQVACAWMKISEHIWEAWKPKEGNGKIPLFIGGIFPITGTYTARGILIAAQMAAQAINRNNSVLSDYDLRMHVYDGQCRTDKVMKSFIDYIRLSSFPHMAGILGPACSDTAEPLAGVATHFKTVVISYSAEGSSFSDREKYPYFFRTIGENKQYQFVYLLLFQHLGWTRVASLTEEGQKYAEYVSHLQDLLQEHKIAFVANRKFPKDRPALNMSQYLQDLKSKKAKIIIGDFYDHAARAVMCEAYHQKMTAKEGFVWFLPVWFMRDWYDTDKHNFQTDKEPIPCTTAEMIQAINGHLSLQYAYYAPENQVMQENITVSAWKTKYEHNCEQKNVDFSDYAGFAYDAMWTYAFALEKLLKQNHSHITNLHSEKTTNTFVKIINETDFYGVSGHIRFIGGPSRVSTINIVQWLDRKTNLVGYFNPNTSSASNTIVGGVLELNASAIKWFTPDGNVPPDGSEPPPQCVLETLANALDVTCEVAIVIANIIGFTILGFVLVKDSSLNKNLNFPVGSTCEQKLDFLSEAEVMKRFEHKNIVKLLGVCTKNEPVYTVMEFMLYGDLKTYLLARRHLVNEKNCEESDEISSRRLTSMALDVARALSYLAELKYVHRDVACRNCLVNASRVVKLGDFGMTRNVACKMDESRILGFGYFHSCFRCLVVWNSDLRDTQFWQFPFPREIQQRGENTDMRVLEFVKSGNTVTIPTGVGAKLEQLLKSCWQLDAQKRPHSAEIVEFLANNPRIVSPCLDIPLASVQLEGTGQLEISMPHRPKPTSNGGATRSSNGGNRVAKTVRTGGDRDPTGNNSRHLFEENIPLTTPKNSSHNSSNHNSNSSAYVSLHHDPKALDGELI